MVLLVHKDMMRYFWMFLSSCDVVICRGSFGLFQLQVKKRRAKAFSKGNPCETQPFGPSTNQWLTSWDVEASKPTPTSYFLTWDKGQERATDGHLHVFHVVILQRFVGELDDVTLRISRDKRPKLWTSTKTKKPTDPAMAKSEEVLGYL